MRLRICLSVWYEKIEDEMNYMDSSGPTCLHDPVKRNRLLRIADCQCTLLSDSFPGSLGACLFLFYSQSYCDYFE